MSPFLTGLYATGGRRAQAIAILAAAAISTARAQAPSSTQAAPPIRTVTAPLAATEPIKSPQNVYELGGGHVIVDAIGEWRLILFDSTFANLKVLADTSGTTHPYVRGTRLIRFLGDSVLATEFASRSLELIEPDGKFGRIMAPPKPQDFNNLTNTPSVVGTDAMGRLVYQGQRPFRGSPLCQLSDGNAVKPPPPRVASDSVAIIRGDFDTRQADTVGRFRVALSGLFPTTVTDNTCRILSASVRLDPTLPTVDSWAMTSTGIIAIMRGSDYHVDWIDAAGAVRSSPKLPFDWRRVTDIEKQFKVDSAKHIADSLTALGGFRIQACGSGMSFTTAPPDTTTRGRGGVTSSSVSVSGRGAAMGGGGDGGPPPTCQNLQAKTEFPALSEMADYIAPIRENSMRADRDGNVWVLPTTSSAAKGGLLYDVVSPAGALVERVQLPPQRDILGFGKGGVLFLSNRVANGIIIERVRVIRSRAQ